MNVLIDFGGFYHYHDEYIEQYAEDCDIDFDNISWRDTFIDYAQGWIDLFNRETGLTLIFEGLDSPRYYNYGTDKINAYIDDADLHQLEKYKYDDGFLEYANPKLTSCSGFHSFYDGIDDLIKRSEDDCDDEAILYGMICDYLIEIKEINNYIDEINYDIYEIY